MATKNSFKLETKNGYDFFEASSAFQKSIRRGLEDQTMFWAIELYESGYQKYCWKRIMVMISEDVGLASHTGPAVIFALKGMYDHFAALKDKHKPEKLHFVHAVQYLVKVKKSRYIDLSIAHHWKYWEENAGEIQVPDFAFDMHTRRGKKMGRGIEHFYEEGSKINNAAKMDREEELEALALEAGIWSKNKPKETRVVKQQQDPLKLL